MLRLISILLVLVSILKPIPIPPIGLIEGNIERPEGIRVRFHPDGQLFTGDQVSIQVFVPTTTVKTESKLKIEVISPNQVVLGEISAQSQSGEMSVFTFLWSWDTRGLPTGEYRLQFSMRPDGNSWQETVRLEAPPTSSMAIWQTRETDCCVLHYFSGSDAERDIDSLANMMDARARQVKEQMHFDTYQPTSEPKKIGRADLPGKPQINLIPRLLGQGGFTSNEITVTYADQNPANTDVGMIIQHELTHLLDNRMGGDLRPLLFVEGVAVYLTGGHYKVEPLILRAAAMLRDGGFLPLNILCEDFYSHQHESSYLEAASLVGYMVETWGWESFNQFYRDIHQKSGQSTADAIDEGLRKHFNLGLRDLDGRLASWLETLPVPPDLAADVQVTSDYFNAIRAYQLAYDPSADFRQVWLPDPVEMRRKGITADYLRSPETPIHRQITRLLRQTGQNWRGGLYPEAMNELQHVRSLLPAQ